MPYSFSSIHRPCANSRAWPRFRSFAGLLLLAGLAVGCGRELIEVVESEASSDFGRGELLSAVGTFSQNGSDAAAYAELRTTVATLRPRFNQRVSDEAELNLVFLALKPLAKHADASLQEQMHSLATTVWPVSTGLEPEEGEAAAAYVRRLCDSNRIADCRFVVPEYWPALLSAAVWGRPGRASATGADPLLSVSTRPRLQPGPARPGASTK